MNVNYESVGQLAVVISFVVVLYIHVLLVVLTRLACVSVLVASLAKMQREYLLLSLHLTCSFVRFWVIMALAPLCRNK